MKVVSQKTRSHYIKGRDVKKYEDCINIFSFIERIRNWDIIYDYYV